jgi:hypothetical protein
VVHSSMIMRIISIYWYTTYTPISTRARALGGPQPLASYLSISRSQLCSYPMADVIVITELHAVPRYLARPRRNFMPRPRVPSKKITARARRPSQM